MSQFDQNETEAAEQQTAPAPEYPAAEEPGDAAFVVESSSPGRGAGIALLVLLLIGGGAIYLMRLKAGPAPAAASAESTNARATIKEFLNDGGKSLSNMRALLENTQKIVQEFINNHAIVQVRVEDLKTNPFRFAAEKPDTSTQDNEAATKAQREKLRAETTKQANALRLQTLLSGSHPTCMINNKLLTIGQDIDGFVVEKIASDEVIVRKNGLAYRLKMSR